MVLGERGGFGAAFMRARAMQKERINDTFWRQKRDKGEHYSKTVFSPPRGGDAEIMYSREARGD
jgi:hypothetical protein